VDELGFFIWRAKGFSVVLGTFFRFAAFADHVVILLVQIELLDVVVVDKNVVSVSLDQCSLKA
jgi:uncharacterized membrane protein